jgi:hypothetical protein
MSYPRYDEEVDAYAHPYEDDQPDEELECAHCGRYMRIEDMSMCDTCRHWFCTSYGDCIQVYCQCGRNYCAADADMGNTCCTYEVPLT